MNKILFSQKMLMELLVDLVQEADKLTPNSAATIHIGHHGGYALQLAVLPADPDVEISEWGAVENTRGDAFLDQPEDCPDIPEDRVLH